MTGNVKKSGRSVRVIRKKETPDEEFERMLELYTMVPPSPKVVKKKRKASVKKISENKGMNNVEGVEGG